MATEWNNRNDRFNHNNGNGSESFHEHNERMRMFRKSHGVDLKVAIQRYSAFKEHSEHMSVFRGSNPSNLEVKVSRRNVINRMWPILIADTRRERGGSSGPLPT